MSYIEVELHLQPFRPFNEIMLTQLSELGFESFVEEETESILKAYITAQDFDIERVKGACNLFKENLKVSIKSTQIKKENWNKKWEENFNPVEVGEFCYIRAPFHEAKKNYVHEIIIEPKMSFGTGHHQTTQMMVELMENIDFKDKAVLDMGSGTGILAVLAKKMGAKDVHAIDIEEWAYENMQENFERNEVNVSTYLGDVDLISSIGKTYDILIANINKNILISHFSIYNKVLKPNGLLLLSGFYKSDTSDLLEENAVNSYFKLDVKTKDTWCALCLQKA